LIEINLAPLDELEDPQWWMPDLFVLFLMFAAAYFVIDSYKNSLNESVAEIEAQSAEFEQNIKNIEPELASFKDLQTHINGLQSKVRALKNITVSKLSKYRPVLILEHLQTLRPQGIWFESFKENTVSRTIEIHGYALDPVIVAQLISEISYTSLQKFDPSDIRTQLYFDGVSLISMENKVVEGTIGEVQPGGYAYFQIVFQDRYREVAASENGMNAH